MKRFSCLIALFGAFMALAPAAHAQWVVIDPANLSNNIMDEIENYLQYYQTVQTELNEYKQLQQQYSSLDGLRNYQSLLNDPTVRQFLPQGWETTLANVATSCSGATGDAYAQCLLTNGQQADQSLLSQAEAQVDARRNQVQSLVNQLSTAQDAKDTADLNTRMDGEIANVLTEIADLQLAQQQEAMDQQQQQQDVLNANLSAPPPQDPLASEQAVQVTPITP
jgi:type IV secretion system protein VirB5